MLFISRFIGVISRFIGVISRFIDVISRFIGVISRFIGGLGRIILMCKCLIISIFLIKRGFMGHNNRKSYMNIAANSVFVVLKNCMYGSITRKVNSEKMTLRFSPDGSG